MTRPWLTVVFLLALVSYTLADTPFGHLQPFGEQGQPLEPVQEVTTSVPPQLLVQKLNKAMPLVMRQVQNSPARQWTEDILREKYGQYIVRVEPKREKTFYETPSEMTISDWLDKYSNRSYIVSQVPKPMYEGFDLPATLRCDPFRFAFIEANIWISSGNTTSTIHKDSLNTVNCQLHGTKNWTLINHKYARMIPLAREDGDPYKSLGGFSTLDVKRVDLIKYPKAGKVPVSKVTMRPGDCLYLPGSYLHQVNSSPGLNMAFTQMFSGRTQLDPDPKLKFRQDDVCDGTTPPTHRFSMNDSAIFYEYSGLTKRDLKMGMDDPYDIVATYVEAADDNRGKLTKKLFLTTLVKSLKEITKRGLDDHHSDMKGSYNNKKEIQKAAKDAYQYFFKPLAKGNGFISMKTLEHAAIYNRDLLKKGFFKYFQIAQYHSLYDHAATVDYREGITGKRKGDYSDEGDHDEL